MAKLTENQQKWKTHIDAASAAGQTLADYSRSHGVELKKLYAYRRAIQQREESRKAIVLEQERILFVPEAD